VNLDADHLRRLADRPELVLNGKDASGDAAPRLVKASSIRMSRPEWIDEGRIPIAGVTLLAGREGHGKTAFVCHLAARITRGQLRGSRHGIPSDVVYLGVEDARDFILVPRLTAAGADLDRVHFLEMSAGSAFAICDHVVKLSRLLDGLEDVALVVVDPLDSHLGERVDSHRKAEVQRAIGMLAVLAQEHSCAVLGIAHLNKGDGRDLLTRVVGSVGFTTAVRSVIGIGEHPDEQRDRVAVLAKTNVTDQARVPAVRFRIEGTTVAAPDGGDPIDTAQVVILGEEYGVDPHSIVSGLGSDERTERDAAIDWLRDLLSGETMDCGEVLRLAKDAGISRATLYRAKDRIKELVVTRDDTRRGRPSTWSLPSIALVSSPPYRAAGETKYETPQLLPGNGSSPSACISSHVPGIETESAPKTMDEAVALLERYFDATIIDEDLSAWCSGRTELDG
jgi:hypothetical protein